jgi:hypothetical protein
MPTFFCVLKGPDLRVFYTLNAPDDYTVENVIDHIHQACQEVETREQRPIIYYVFNESSSTTSGFIEELQVGGPRYPRHALAQDVFDEHNILYVPDADEEEDEIQEEAPFFDLVLADIAATMMTASSSSSSSSSREEMQFMTLDELFVLAENMSYVNVLLGGGGGDRQQEQQQQQNYWQQQLTDVVVGIDLEELNKQHPVFVYEEKEEGEEACCVICMEAYEKKEVCRLLACTHWFHKRCIDAWLGQNIKCPVCRAECGQGIAQLN